MSKCLCCGKELNTNDINANLGWHDSCVKRFFGTKTLPKIELSPEFFESFVMQNTIGGFTVPGVQKKISLGLEKTKDNRLTLVDYPAGYILKPQADEYENLPEAEHTVMLMSEAAGISVVDHALIPCGKGKQLAFITKRIDRLFTQSSVKKIAMEDFCQIDGRLEDDKYKGSYERCMKIIDSYSINAGLDKTEFFMRLVSSFVFGNSDMHLKNFSLIEDAPGSRRFKLSKAYDLLPVNIVAEDDEELALTMCGKKSNINKKTFLSFAETSGINEKAANNMIAAITKKLPTYEQIVKDSTMPQKEQIKMLDLMKNRISMLIED